MHMNIKLNLKALAIAIAIPIAGGFLSAFLAGDSKGIFESLVQPPLSPPSWLFPVAWSILYVLMGISSYLVYTSKSFYEDKVSALKIYGVQLIVNFLWSIFFFRLEQYVFSFIWLLLLWVLIIFTIKKFYAISKAAAYLLIPYLLWVTFAGYLNLGIAMLN